MQPLDRRLDATLTPGRCSEHAGVKLALHATERFFETLVFRAIYFELWSNALRLHEVNCSIAPDMACKQLAVDNMRLRDCITDKQSRA